jgi:hypothetical protein
VDKIGRLRALEKDIASADRLLGKSRKLDPDVLYGRVFINHRETILSLIAELGQEVGAVPLWISRHWREDLARDSVVSVVNREDSAHSLQVYVSTSPAHTSEARDAARYRWLRENCEVNGPDWVVWLDDKECIQLDDRIDAAMRQEAGDV